MFLPAWQINLLMEKRVGGVVILVNGEIDSRMNLRPVKKLLDPRGFKKDIMR
jgi:hypothetical protein